MKTKTKVKKNKPGIMLWDREKNMPTNRDYSPTRHQPEGSL